MRDIKFEYGFESINGIVKKVYFIHEIPEIKNKCDVWDQLPIKYVRQYTGLKDKNGVEIYEGDIVIHETLYGDNKVRDKIKGAVYHEDGCYYVNSALTTRDGIYFPTLYSIISKYAPTEYSCEIIGNIHQHPELIK